MKFRFYQKVLVLSAVILVIAIMWKFEPGCLVQRFLNIPCPTCGMTRSFFALLNGNFEMSFNLHPMLLSVPVLLLMFLFYEKLFTGRLKFLSVTVLVFILFGFLINYLQMF